MRERLISNLGGIVKPRPLAAVTGAGAALAMAGTLMAVSGAATAGASAPGAAPEARAAASSWTTGMRITKPGGCDLYPSLYKTTRPITGNAWHENRGHSVGWRYRVNTTWTLVFDHHHRIAGHAHWGFIETACLKGNRYPAGAKDGRGRVRDLSGKGSKGFRHVRFGSARARGTRTAGIRSVVRTYITMRDMPRAFVIANLYRGGTFTITRRCTGHHNDGQGHSPWIYGLDRQSHRWGWVPSGALRGNPCLKAR